MISVSLNIFAKKYSKIKKAAKDRLVLRKIGVALICEDISERFTSVGFSGELIVWRGSGTKINHELS